MPRFWIIAALVGSSPSTAFAEECRLHVDAGALSERMIALLAKEVPDCEVVTSSGAATLTLAIMRINGHLDVAMIAPPSTPVLARRVAIDEGDPEPALRRIALLTARAIESSSLLPEDVIEAEISPVRDAGWHLSMAAAFATQWWSSPSDRPAFAPALAVTVELGDFDLGLWGAWFVKRDRSVDGLKASATEVSLLVRGSWCPLTLGPLSLGLELGGGIDLLSFRAKPIKFVAGTDQTHATPIQGLVRFGAVVQVELADRLDAFGRGGGLVRIGQVELEYDDDYGDEPIRTGVLRPWVELGLALRFF